MILLLLEILILLILLMFASCAREAFQGGYYKRRTLSGEVRRQGVIVRFNNTSVSAPNYLPDQEVLESLITDQEVLEPLSGETAQEVWEYPDRILTKELIDSIVQGILK